MQRVARPRVLFIVYVEGSESAAKETFEKLSTFFGPNTRVAGLGDSAYIDARHTVHALKGKVRYFISIEQADSEKQIKDLASFVAAQI